MIQGSRYTGFQKAYRNITAIYIGRKNHILICNKCIELINCLQFVLSTVDTFAFHLNFALDNSIVWVKTQDISPLLGFCTKAIIIYPLSQPCGPLFFSNYYIKLVSAASPFQHLVFCPLQQFQTLLVFPSFGFLFGSFSLAIFGQDVGPIFNEKFYTI